MLPVIPVRKRGGPPVLHNGVESTHILKSDNPRRKRLLQACNSYITSVAASNASNGSRFVHAGVVPNKHPELAGGNDPMGQSSIATMTMTAYRGMVFERLTRKRKQRRNARAATGRAHEESDSDEDQEFVALFSGNTVTGQKNEWEQTQDICRILAMQLQEWHSILLRQMRLYTSPVLAMEHFLDRVAKLTYEDDRESDLLYPAELVKIQAGQAPTKLLATKRVLKGKIVSGMPHPLHVASAVLCFVRLLPLFQEYEEIVKYAFNTVLQALHVSSNHNEEDADEIETVTPTAVQFAAFHAFGSYKTLPVRHPTPPQASVSVKKEEEMDIVTLASRESYVQRFELVARRTTALKKHENITQDNLSRQLRLLGFVCDKNSHSAMGVAFKLWRELTKNRKNLRGKFREIFRFRGKTSTGKRCIRRWLSYARHRFLEASKRHEGNMTETYDEVRRTLDQLKRDVKDMKTDVGILEARVARTDADLDIKRKTRNDNDGKLRDVAYERYETDQRFEQCCWRLRALSNSTIGVEQQPWQQTSSKAIDVLSREASIISPHRSGTPSNASAAAGGESGVDLQNSMSTSPSVRGVAKFTGSVLQQRKLAAIEKHFESLLARCPDAKLRHALRRQYSSQVDVKRRMDFVINCAFVAIYDLPPPVVTSHTSFLSVSTRPHCLSFLASCIAGLPDFRLEEPPGGEGRYTPVMGGEQSAASGVVYPVPPSNVFSEPTTEGNQSDGQSPVDQYGATQSFTVEETTAIFSAGPIREIPVSYTQTLRDKLAGGSSIGENGEKEAETAGSEIFEKVLAVVQDEHGNRCGEQENNAAQHLRAYLDAATSVSPDEVKTYVDLMMDCFAPRGLISQARASQRFGSSDKFSAPVKNKIKGNAKMEELLKQMASKHKTSVKEVASYHLERSVTDSDSFIRALFLSDDIVTPHTAELQQVFCGDESPKGRGLSKENFITKMGDLLENDVDEDMLSKVFDSAVALKEEDPEAEAGLVTTSSISNAYFGFALIILSHYLNPSPFMTLPSKFGHLMQRVGRALRHGKGLNRKNSAVLLETEYSSCL